MNAELDPNKLVVEFVNSNIDRLTEVAAGVMKGTRNAVRSRLDRTYREYLTRILGRYSKAKSFFIRSEAIPLYEFFVPLDLSTEQRTLRMPSAQDIGRIAPSAIICGSGGSGKSMLMRHLLISAIESGLKTPIFLELRQLNQDTESVRSSLLRSLQTNGLDVDDAYFEVALKAGHFSILLDGFDELELSLREEIATEIGIISTEYPKNWWLISSRPDIILQGWSDFTQFHL